MNYYHKKINHDYYQIYLQIGKKDDLEFCFDEIRSRSTIPQIYRLYIDTLYPKNKKIE